MNKTNHKKVVIIGLDGATFSLIMPWVKEGKLPVFSKLIHDGAWGNLRSTIPTNTAPAWTSFMTGKNPGKHGVFHFLYHTGESYDIKFANGLRRKAKSIWKLLSEQDKKVCVFNVPLTYPPEEVNGSMISGLTSPEVSKKIFYPQELLKEIISEVGMFSIKPFPEDHIKKNRFDRVFDEMYSVIDQHYKVADYLFQKKGWDFFCVVFGTTDHVQHFFWQHMDPDHPFHNPSESALYGDCIFKIYKKVDEMIGSFLERLDDDTTVLILSDHGAGANGNRAFYVNNWLAHEGLLTYKGNSSDNSNSDGFLKNSIFFAKKYIPRKYKNKLGGIFPRLKSRVKTIYWDSCIDWSRTKAFSYGNNELIWINRKGREFEGVVSDDKEYESIRNKIIEKALDFRDPESGKKVFSEALRREDIYSGDATNLAPDIILVQKERQYMYPYRDSSLSKSKSPIETVTLEETRNNPIQMGSHRMDGIVIIKGTPVQSGKNITGAKIIDIAPTVLYLMGAPIPKDMDGSVITEAIKESYLNANPINYSNADNTVSPERRGSEYSKAEEKQIEELLRSIGYID